MSTPPLSKDEVRRRRLAALSGNPVQSSPTPSSAPAASAASSPEAKKQRGNNDGNNYGNDDDDEMKIDLPPLDPFPQNPTTTVPESKLYDSGSDDEELKRALTMSMGQTFPSNLASSSPRPPSPTVNFSPQPDFQPTTQPPTSTEDDEIARAIALSLAESKPQPPQQQEFTPTFTSTPQTSTSESVEIRKNRIQRSYEIEEEEEFNRVIHGGPCGILAVLGAEILSWLLFDSSSSFPPSVKSKFISNLQSVCPASPTPSPQTSSKSEPGVDSQTADLALSLAIGRVLARAALQGVEDEYPGGGVRVVTGEDGNFVSKCIWIDEEEGKDLNSVTHSLSLLTSNYLLSSSSSILNNFKSPGGVLSLTRSLFATRGPSKITADMDSPPPECAFTAQFGHSSQELINLLLTGAATSNVFDGIMDMGGLQMKGCISRPGIGYLTQLEALRYVQTGTYYKTPLKPIWLIGSSSHFSVMFSLDDKPIRESNSDKILERCRRAFKVVDGEGDGFINMTSLGEVLQLLGLMDVVGEAGLPRLADSLEEAGCGIILWDSFWKAVSRLLTGASLESVLEKKNTEVIVVDQEGKSSETKEETKLNFEVDSLGDTFILYHYNGLREGMVTPFLVQRLSAEDAVGASVAMENVGGGGEGGIEDWKK
ncbi:hypothetical protein TL16_g05293 [Triparma laevis f. inornata]|uniref:ubiquitinyl hydrolase 1 n=1 Tax=Triparma laevis f. inornata TaxID=1714386 RepID=A0A9W7AG51_9STRA|nr:hypothetical protein TL16_g05293 [Triparma laevis f. inornata]